MIGFRKHLIKNERSIRDALTQLNKLGADAILFVVGEKDELIGSLTDGDIRRGFISGLSFEDPLSNFLQANPVYIRQETYTIEELEDYKQRSLKVIPIVDGGLTVIGVLNLRLRSSLLPIEAVVMAGGRGERLMPLTETCPKPMLKVGDKPIIEHNVDRLASYGISRIYISIRYLGRQIVDYLGDGRSKDVNIRYVEETEPLGTFGSLGLIDDFTSDHVLLMNSDLLTNIDFTDFYQSYLASGADLMVASIPYQVNVPYAILKIDDGEVISFDEKPTYSYYSNGGIYLFKRSLLTFVKKGSFLNATDFMELLIANKRRVKHYPILGYWLDIGRPEDFEKAQKDIGHIRF